MTGPRLDFAPHIERIARAALGEPNRELSTRTQLRYGRHGSLAVELDGDKRGSWYDHQEGVGGGPWDLAVRAAGGANGSALQWLRGLGIEAPQPAVKAKTKGRIVTTYPYHDEAGKLLFQVVRFADPKDFRQRRPNGRGGWIWSVKGTRQVPYRLPEMLARPEGAPVYVVEGEKDADRLAGLGLCATTNPGGASNGKSKWRAELNPHFAGADVVILPDNDEVGRNHAQTVAASLQPVAASVRVVELPGLPPKGDVSDWLDGDGTVEELQTLAERTPPWAHAEALATHDPEALNGQTIPPPRPKIRVMGGDLADATAASLEVLAREQDPLAAIYVRGGLLVRPLRLANRLAAGGLDRPLNALALRVVDVDALRLRLAQLADFYVGIGKKERAVDVPTALCRCLLAAAPWDELPGLTGVVEAPTIRPDGSVLDRPGYDAETGLLFDPGGIRFPPVPDRPTRAQAEAAVEVLKQPFAAFPCVSDADRSVALSSVLSALLVRSLRAVPLFGASAPKMASGKTLITTIPSYIACGRTPYLMSQVQDPADERKRLLAALLEGPAMLVIDNVERPLRSDAICTAITEATFTDRLLGASRTVTVETNCMFAATGNNLRLAGDLSSRAVICTLDPGVERPEQRTFAVNLHQWVPVHRGELAAAALTVIRAFIVAGEPDQGVPNFARFEDWQRFCRFPLIWLGLADPCATREGIEATDPVREALRALLGAWHAQFDDVGATVKAAIDAATRSPDLRAAMEAVAGDKGGINARVLGNFISKHERRIEGGLRFERARARGGVTYWRAHAGGGFGGFGGFTSGPSRDPVFDSSSKCSQNEQRGTNQPNPPNPPSLSPEAEKVDL
jgi:putative DNA primase/helicase